MKDNTMKKISERNSYSEYGNHSNLSSEGDPESMFRATARFHV